MIHIGAQYYRPPFPLDKHWEDDFRLMADTGLNAVQLWVVWAWVEASPGTYDFSDYERLVETADKYGLDVVLSTIAAIHPYWIHQEEPGSEMINNSGHRIVSSNRVENHYGLTPGGCIDHPGVWKRMERFIKATTECFKEAPNIAGWDAWNELRWNVQAEGMVCYCDHTVAAFRSWLDQKYGGLEGLNAAWLRRYPDWSQVNPGIMPDRPFTEMMAFQEFITWRANEHALARYRVIKAIDPERSVTVHGGNPTVLHAGDGYPNTALHRGNDWVFAEEIDGIGCSSFPYMFAPNGGIRMTDSEFFFRLESLRSAAGSKKIWISELQGGRGNINFALARSVPSYDQQRWLWTGLSIGAEKILFWCWRDEVFGRESNGFGIIGNDGYREDRLQGLAKTADVLKKYGKTVEGFKPNGGEVGILFSTTSIYLAWSQESNGWRVLSAVQGYGEALQSLQISYTIVEDNHLDILRNIKILFAPAALALSDQAKHRLEEFVRGGGILVCEPEVGAFTDAGLYTYPDERWIHRLAGTREVGRRQSGGSSVEIPFQGIDYRMRSVNWVTPFREDGECADRHDSHDLIRSASVGDGKVILLGAFLGDAAKSAGEVEADQVIAFRRFVAALVSDSGVTSDVGVTSCSGEGAGQGAGQGAATAEEVRISAGMSGGKKVIFLFAPRETDSVGLQLSGALGGRAEFRDIFSETVYAVDESPTILIEDFWCGMSVLVEQ